MNDNIKDEEKNQLPPIFETVPVDENLQPEEVSPEVATPTVEEVASAGPETIEEAPPLVYETNKSKYFIIIGATILFFFLLIFFLKAIFSGSKKPKPISLTYWGLWEEKEIFAPLISLYQQKNSHIKINYEKMSPIDYKDRLLARSKNNQGPDIFRFHNTWLPQLREVAAPLPETVLTSQEFEKIFFPVHQKDLKIGNHYYGIPLMIDGLVLIYNQDLFEKAGINTSPTNWDEINEMVSKLTVKDINGQLLTAGIALGTASNVEHFSDIFGLMLLQNGGDLKNLDQPEAAGALESYRKFAEPPNDFWNEQMPNSITAFIQEKVAMIIVPSWEILVIKSANPDLKIKVVPVPQVPGGKPVSLASYWVEGVSRYSKNQIEAWKFLKFLSEKENLAKLYQSESQNRLFGEAYSRVDMSSLLSQNEYLGAVIKQTEYYVSLPLISRTFDNGLNDQIIQYLENAINSTIQGVAYNEALNTAKKGIDQIFSQYKIE
ncbi:MAG: sugar ABC transporter substrate-binding protein [Patescibacteria group bacterium]|nr:sugar ABC transporter substrate-binding protein [Patescibacteria group bacterium]